VRCHFPRLPDITFKLPRKAVNQAVKRG
jgi:hypothetical protein